LVAPAGGRCESTVTHSWRIVAFQVWRLKVWLTIPHLKI
jgi:hypothetical protein